MESVIFHAAQQELRSPGNCQSRNKQNPWFCSQILILIDLFSVIFQVGVQGDKKPVIRNMPFDMHAVLYEFSGLRAGRPRVSS